MLGFCVPDTYAQSEIKYRYEIAKHNKDTTIFLGDWVIEESVRVYLKTNTTETISWNFDPISGLIRIYPFPKDSLIIEFSRLPIALPKTINLHPRIEVSKFSNDEDGEERVISSQENIGFTSDLTQSGSLSRGIIVGSNQDFALESGLQFELSGQLTDDISLDAVLTDQSIPIQPDGTTQSIREFDKVLIRLHSKNASLEMGDVDISLQQSTFAKLNRRLQGAAGSYQSETASTTAALSSVRGTFVTQQFDGEDGVKGPYRLRGKNGEEFIIVLAGTERIYINGIQVQRGEESEYIIDYGLGEITFTDNVFIKDETRIFVEYEYIDQDFNRTLIAAEASDSFFDERLSVGVSVIRQADGDDLLSQQTLSEKDIGVLQQAGDDLNQAVVSGVITNPDVEDFNVRYARIDTTFNGQVFSIFKNIPNSPASNLAVRFSNVGIGNGSYNRIGDTINGLLYQWVGPGIGNYEPFRQLPAPEKHQMVALNTNVEFSEKLTFSGELAISDLDRNRFSSLDNNDNTDLAFKSTLSAKELDLGFASIDLNYNRRQSGNNFEFFERTREVEFDRKWNINEQDIAGEKLDEFETVVNFSDQSALRSGLGRLSFDGFESIRQNSILRVNESQNFSVDYSQEYISSTNKWVNTTGQWFRQLGRITTEIGSNFFPFVHFEHEDRRDLNNGSELLNTSLKFYEVGPGISYSNKRLTISMAYILRNEEGIIGEEFRKEASAREQRYQLGYNSNSGFTTNNNIHFRNKDFTNAFEANGNRDQNGFQLNSTTVFNRKTFSSRLIYKANTQRQAIRQEAYIEVGPELGQYVWIDENENGIEEIIEFYPELSPNEGTYILQFLPSDELLPVINLNSQFTVEWQPFKSTSRNNYSFYGLQTIRLTSLIDLRENSTTENEGDIYLLRLENFRNDSTTLNGAIRLEQGIELDLTENVSFRLSYNSSDNLNKRTSEVQRKKNNQVFIDAVYKLKRDFRLRLDASFGNNKLQSDEISSRTYDIKFLSINPGLTSRISRSLQLGFNTGYTYKEDAQFELVKASAFKVSTFSRAFLWQKVQTSINIEIRNTQINGSRNSFTNFELTEGTGTGTNLVWSLNANYRINSLVRLNFNYDGRTVKDRPDIHTIKLVVSAVF